ncbi:MAG: hypothetical protein FRX49_04776 [Trebouxia sp. A1-2]|nr:MAG: hypothetical protein FRX49_04776 [Trebouxia sp. A1-2]
MPLPMDVTSTCNHQATINAAHAVRCTVSSDLLRLALELGLHIIPHVPPNGISSFGTAPWRLKTDVMVLKATSLIAICSGPKSLVPLAALGFRLA